jgi:hypothetical protein
MVAGGAGAAVRAARMKANPRRVYYGGSADAYNGIAENYADRTDAGAGVTQTGVDGLMRAGGTGDTLAQSGQGLVNAGMAQSVGRDMEYRLARERGGMSLLDAYQPGQVARAQAQQAADQVGRQNLAAGATGGALGLRSALYANAASGQQVAQQAAVTRSQEQQALLAAKVAQQNSDRDTGFGQYQALEAQRLGTIGLGGQLAASGNAQVLQAGNAVGNVGLGTQNIYQSALENTQNSQFSADMDFEQRRQAEKQRRQQNMWNLAGSLITGGASVAASGAGGVGGK